MATTWKPLELLPVDYVRPTAHIMSKTPFDAEMPTKVPEEYYNRSNAGLHYALYALAHLGREDVSDLLHTIKCHMPEDKTMQASKVARAPIYDFCSSKSLRDIYNYHTSLLDEGNHGIAYGRFIVAAHADWETQGVIIVDFDCHPLQRGTLGILRVQASGLPHCLALLETSNRNWTDLKAAELDTKWPDSILGYSGSHWQTLGYQYYCNKWLKGDY